MRKAWTLKKLDLVLDLLLMDKVKCLQLQPEKKKEKKIQTVNHTGENVCSNIRFPVFMGEKFKWGINQFHECHLIRMCLCCEETDSDAQDRDNIQCWWKRKLHVVVGLCLFAALWTTSECVFLKFVKIDCVTLVIFSHSGVTDKTPETVSSSPGLTRDRKIFICCKSVYKHWKTVNLMLLYGGFFKAFREVTFLIPFIFNFLPNHQWISWCHFGTWFKSGFFHFLSQKY